MYILKYSTSPMVVCRYVYRYVYGGITGFVTTKSFEAAMKPSKFMASEEA
jgi:hypothetical protein